MSYNLFKFLIISSLEYYFFNQDNLKLVQYKTITKIFDEIFDVFKVERKNLSYVATKIFINEITDSRFLNAEIDFNFKNYTSKITSIFAKEIYDPRLENNIKNFYLIVAIKFIISN